MSDHDDHDDHDGHDDHEGHDAHKGHDHHEGHGDHHQHMLADFRRRFWLSLALTVPVLVLSPTIRGWTGLAADWSFPGLEWLQWGLATVILLAGGWPFYRGIVRELGRLRPGMMTLISVAITVAWGWSSAVVFGVEGQVFFWELATLVDIMLLGHWLEMRSVMGASKALDELVRLMPAEAHRLDEGGGTTDVPVAELGPDDRVLVRPGERIPVDGEVVDGESTVDQHLISGESEPVAKGVGDAVVGGAINGDGSLTVRVEKTGDESYLGQVIELVRSAQESKSRNQDLADRAAAWLTAIALTAGAVTLLVWWLAVGAPMDRALERAVTVMIITCPHALGLAVPLVISVSTTLAASRGILIRNRGPFERARDLGVAIFDKTGTLTTGDFAVEAVIPFGDRDGGDLRRRTAALERASEHPIARAIVGNLEGLPPVEDFENLKGRGVRGRVEGIELQVVSGDHLQREGIELPERDDLTEQREAGATVVFVLENGELAGAIALADQVREESREAIDALRERGVICRMLTGDNETVARRVAKELGIDDVTAGVLPEDKAEAVAALAKEGRVVAMIGDGVNDAPALARADVGIAIGAGTDVAIESADLVLVENDPRAVVTVMDLARATHRKVVQNLVWATGYNVVAIPLAAGVLAPWGVLLPPAVGAIVMSVSTVVVAINARLLKL